MKKILAILLGLVMILSLCACGGEPKPQPDEDGSGDAATVTEEPAEDSTGGVFAGTGYTIDYPATVEEKTGIFGGQILADNGGIFEVEPKVLDDQDYETTVSGWVEGQKTFEDYSKEDIEAAGLPGVRITYTDSLGHNILYLIKLSDQKTIFLNFSGMSGTLEDLAAAPEIEQIVNGIKVDE